VTLFERFHGTQVTIDSPQVQQVYALFVTALQSGRDSGRPYVPHCNHWMDGNFLIDILTPQQLALVRRPADDGDWWWDDHTLLGPIMGRLTMDTNGAKRGWVAVIAYLLTHFDYVHE
jgi:hypothetical protein